MLKIKKFGLIVKFYLFELKQQYLITVLHEVCSATERYGIV
jgi:hypothetical protein